MKKIIPCIISLIILITPLTVHAETVDFNTWSLKDFHKIMCTYYPYLCSFDTSKWPGYGSTVPVKGKQAWHSSYTIQNGTDTPKTYNSLSFTPDHILLFCNSDVAILVYSERDKGAANYFEIDTDQGIMSSHLVGVSGHMEYYVFNAQNPYGQPKRFSIFQYEANADISIYGFTSKNIRLLMTNDIPVYIKPQLPGQYDVATPEMLIKDFIPGESDYVPDLDPDMQIADILYYLNLINSNVSNINNLPTFFGSLSDLLSTISDSLIYNDWSVGKSALTIKNQVTSIIQKVNNMDKNLSSILSNSTTNSTFINDVLTNISSVLNDINTNILSLIQAVKDTYPILDGIIVEVQFTDIDITKRQDASKKVLDNLLTSVDNILLYFTNKDQEKEDTESFSLNISNLANDNSTIFGASAQLKTQIESFLTTIDGSGTTSFEVGYSTNFVGQNINNKVKIDNSFYAPYKEKGDAFISAFMWLAFIFSFFRNLGSILEGAGFHIVKHTIISDDGENSASYVNLERW